MQTIQFASQQLAHTWALRLAKAGCGTISVVETATGSTLAKGARAEARIVVRGNTQKGSR